MEKRRLLAISIMAIMVLCRWGSAMHRSGCSEEVFKNTLLQKLACVPAHADTIPLKSFSPIKNNINIDVPPTERPSMLFRDKENASLYWQALIHLTRNNKETAEALAMAINEKRILATCIATDTLHPIDTFFDDLFIASVSRDPQGLSGLGLFESIGIDEHNAYLNDVSPDALVAVLQDSEARLRVLEQFDVADLSAEQKTTKNLCQWELQRRAARKSFLYHDYSINQMDGVLTNLVFLFTQHHPLRTANDVKQYITRLARVPQQIQQAMKFLERQVSVGIRLPRFAMLKVINIIQNLMPVSVTEHIFYQRFAEALEGLAFANKDSLLEQAKEALEQHVYPAYQRLLDFYRGLLETTHTNHGVWALPSGDAYYAYALEGHTSSGLSADQIHVLGLQEVDKILTAMRQILISEGFTDENKGTIELLNEFAKNPSYYYENSEKGRQQCIEGYNTILDRCRKELYPLFDLKPRSPVKVLPIPKHEEEGMPGAYYLPPTIDGLRPGIFFANLRDMQESPMYRMETLAVHEAEPGHHFQLALQQELNMHILRKIGGNTAYVEGWALYVEKLAYENDFYSSPAMQLGHFQDELLRAARLVLDTGIHSKRWTREQAIEYMVNTTGFPYNEAVTEVERYFVLPGQACAYKVGQLKILELRQRAKDKLGKKFDIRDFHNVVLKLGACPLRILEETIDEYIAQKIAA
ncbi:DUF885 domain-containing protein [Candidatus Dependentiae bacterium]|nr:DUF885 domain-containing protein [Candidatus Dependentiae bacterium]